MSTTAPHWAGIGETTFVAGIRLLYFIDRWFGRGLFRVCLGPVVFGHWLFNTTARRASVEYLRRVQQVYGVFPRASGMGMSLRHFALFADTLLDKLLASQGHYPVDRIRIENEVMLAQMATGQGGVIVTAHIGCLELCEALADTVPGFHLTALVHTVHAEKFNRLLARLNPNGRVRLLQVDALDAATAAQLGERVAQGEYIAIAGDRVPVRSVRTVQAAFLGRPAPFPIGPYVLAAALGCPLFALACTHAGDGYHIRFSRLCDRVLLPRATREAAIAAQVASFVSWLEVQLHRSPLDWFNFFPFWDQDQHDSSVR